MKVICLFLFYFFSKDDIQILLGVFSSLSEYVKDYQMLLSGQLLKILDFEVENQVFF